MANAQAYDSAFSPNRGEAPATVEAPSKSDLARLKRMVSEAQTLTMDGRAQSLTDQDYYDGHQWTPEERAELRSRGQPDNVINRARAAINGILGVTEQAKSEPRAWPREPGDEDSADVVTDVLTFVADKTRFSRVKQDCFTDMLVPGSMAALIGGDDELMPTVEQIRWEELIYDPKSRRRDFKDARYMGIAKWMYADDVIDLYPDKASDIEGTISGGGLISDPSFMDRPMNGQNTWVDRRQRRLMLIELYYRESQVWKRCVFHAGGLLEEGDSPYLDDKRKPCNPIEAQSAYVDRNNNRYGAMRDMRGPQDEINKRRSKLLHLINASQIQAIDPMAVEVDTAEARKEAARPDGVIPPGWQKVATTDVAAGQMQLMIEAKAELERLGPNPAVLGRQGADSSGRALLARQQAGMVELATLFGGLEDWELRVYRQIWARVKQWWRAPMFIRVTNDEDAPKFVGLNQPIPGPPQIGVHPETGLPSVMPSVLGYKNPVGEMDVDIKLDTTPDTATLQQEQFQDLMRLVSSSPLYQQQVPFHVLINLSSIPRKRQVMDMLKKASEEQQQGQAQAQQAQQQLAQDMAQAKIDETHSKAVLNQVKGLALVGGNTLAAIDMAHQHQPPPAQALPPPDQGQSPAPFAGA